MGMKNIRKLIIPCMKCGQENRYDEVRLVDVTDDPDLRDAVFHDEIFLYRCDCGFEEYFHHPIVYIDRKNQFIVVYGNNRTMFKHFIETMRENGLFASYQVRWCDHWYSFKEKIFIFEHHRDDRILALYKELLLKDFHEHYPDLGQGIAFYDIDGDEETFTILSEQEETKHYLFPHLWYSRKMKEQGLKQIMRYDSNPYVNDDYALAIHNHRIKVRLAQVEVGQTTSSYVLSYFDDVHVGDEVYVPAARRSSRLGKVVAVKTHEAREIPRSLKTIIAKKQSDDDWETKREFLNLLGQITTRMEPHQALALLELVDQLNVYVPCVMRENDDVIFEEIAYHEERYIPLFLKEEDLYEIYPDKQRLFMPFSIIRHLLPSDMDGFVFEPQREERFVAEEMFLELFEQFTQAQNHHVN